MKKLKKYRWDRPKCVRFGEDMTSEVHPCYFCGLPTKIEEMNFCDKCGFYNCSNCGIGCVCNSNKQIEAMKYLRNKYCCNLTNFELGQVGSELETLRLVPNFFSALNYCRAIRK